VRGLPELRRQRPRVIERRLAGGQLIELVLR
jgi:hypothetical protein